MDNGLTPQEVNALYPIIGAILYDGALIVTRLSTQPYDGIRRQPGSRGKIEYLSKRSRVNLGLVARVNGSKFHSLLTLTYGQAWPATGKRVKRDLNLIMTRLRQVYRPLSYLWFLEFQKRGAPHIHILLSVPAGDAGALAWVSDMWARVCTDGLDWEYCALYADRGRLVRGGRLRLCQAVRSQHRRPETWQNLRSDEGASRYVTKYALKTRQKLVPENFQDVGRFWGASRDCKVSDGEIVFGSESQIREFLRLKGRDFGHYEVLPRVCYF